DGCGQPGQRIGAPAQERGLGAGLGRGIEYVVTDPDLEQVAQDEQCVGPAAGGLRQPVEKRLRRGRLGGLQVQVRDDIDRLPVRGYAQLGKAAAAIHSTTTAFSMTTSSLGTSSWKPRRPVGTPSIFLTISVPLTTLPNTA